MTNLQQHMKCPQDVVALFGFWPKIFSPSDLDMQHVLQTTQKRLLCISFHP